MLYIFKSFEYNLIYIIFFLLFLKIFEYIKNRIYYNDFNKTKNYYLVRLKHYYLKSPKNNNILV